MGKITVELDITEAVKLLSMCNAAIVGEEESLRYVSHNEKIKNDTKESIQKMLDIKRKIKHQMVETYKEYF